MDKQKFAFDKTNFILLGVGMLIIILGFLLMTGSGSTEGYFEPDIFSARRIKVYSKFYLLQKPLLLAQLLLKKHFKQREYPRQKPKKTSLQTLV